MNACVNAYYHLCLLDAAVTVYGWHAQGNALCCIEKRNNLKKLKQPLTRQIHPNMCFTKVSLKFRNYLLSAAYKTEPVDFTVHINTLASCFYPT